MRVFKRFRTSTHPRQYVQVQILTLRSRKPTFSFFFFFFSCNSSSSSRGSTGRSGSEFSLMTASAKTNDNGLKLKKEKKRTQNKKEQLITGVALLGRLQLGMDGMSVHLFNVGQKDQLCCNRVESSLIAVLQNYGRTAYLLQDLSSELHYKKKNK